MTTFEDFITEIEAEAEEQGPEAVAELEAFRLHFSLARKIATQPGDVRNRLAGNETPTRAEAQRLTALASIAGRLARLVKPEYIASWLATPNPALGGDAPLDRLAANDHHAVAQLISGLEDPGAS